MKRISWNHSYDKITSVMQIFYRLRVPSAVTLAPQQADKCKYLSVKRIPTQFLRVSADTYDYTDMPEHTYTHLYRYVRYALVVWHS